MYDLELVLEDLRHVAWSLAQIAETATGEDNRE